MLKSKIKRDFDTFDDHVGTDDGDDQTHDLADHGDDVFSDAKYETIPQLKSPVGQDTHQCKYSDHDGDSYVAS